MTHVPRKTAPPKVSVVVPTLNEERYLPVLLASLAAQTLPVHEVIVADGGSSDRTAEIASSAGARIVPGGHPGVGRNAGAQSATGEWLLFLDGDVRLPADALEVAFAEMEREGLDSASCWFVPDSEDPFLRLNRWISSHYFRMSSKLRWPHSIGAFLLLKKEGTLATSLKWIGIELHRLVIGEIRGDYFRYFK